MVAGTRKKLLLVGTGVVHTFKYLDLVSSFFDEVVLVTDRPRSELAIRQIQFDFSLRSPLRIRSKILLLRKEIEAFKPDIIHVHQANSCSFYTLKACDKKYPVVVTAWGSDILAASSKGFIYRYMLKYILCNADCFTSDSKYMAEEMRRMAGKKYLNILIANFGIDILPLKVEKEDMIYSNRQLTPLYRIDKIIELFGQFINSGRSFHHWKLAIAATGPEEEKLKEMVARNGLENNVTFHGWVDKEANSVLYGKARIYVSIPQSDATSISLLEAMASSCIPVVSDLPANKEWIRDGVNGIVYGESTGNPFIRALNLNTENVINMNSGIIESEGTKEANRLKFISMYENLMHGN